MRNYKGNMLLIELVIVLLFFSLSSAVLLQVFAKAQQINTNSRIANEALLAAENAAETLCASSDAKQALIALGFEKASESFYTLTSDAGYRLTASLRRLTQPSGVQMMVDLQAFRGDTSLFTLPAARYTGVNPS